MEAYETIIKIRTFEEHILGLFSKNMLSGTTHTYIGEEATAVAVMQYVEEEDTVFSNHRWLRYLKSRSFLSLRITNMQ